MRFFFQVLLLFFLLFPVNSTLAQIKNECVADEGDHLLMMERMPNNRYFCVDARFLNRCQGPDNGKVTVASSYSETDSLRGEFISTIGIFSKTDSQIKIALGRIATAVKKEGQYELFFGMEGNARGTYLATAETRINGQKVKAMRSGRIRQNTYLLEVSDKVRRVLVSLEDPCERESEEELYEDTTKKGEKTARRESSLPCELGDIEHAFSNLQSDRYETALSGFDHKHRIAYAVLLDYRTKGVSLIEVAFDESCMPIETSYKDYIDVKKFFDKLEGPTVNKSLKGLMRGKEILSQAKKKYGSK